VAAFQASSTSSAATSRPPTVRSSQLREADIVARRVSFWRNWVRTVLVVVVTLLWVVLVFFGHGLTGVGAARACGLLRTSRPELPGTLITLPLFFLFNLIFMGPML
jgi:hypothetical protein